MARRKGAGDEYVVQVMLNYSDTLGMVKAELKCDLEPSTMEIARAGEPMQNNGADRERKTTRIEGVLAEVNKQTWPRPQLMEQDENDVGADHRLMGCIIRHCCWEFNRFQVKGDRRTANTRTRHKEHDMSLVQLREVCSFRRHDADDTKVELRRTSGVFVGRRENPKISCCRPRKGH